MIKYILMSALLPLLPVEAQAQQPPACLVSHEDLTEAQQKLFNVADPRLLREQAATAGFEVVQLEGAVVLFDRNLFNLEHVERQIRACSTLVKHFSATSRVKKSSELTEAERADLLLLTRGHTFSPLLATLLEGGGTKLHVTGRLSGEISDSSQTVRVSLDIESLPTPDAFFEQPPFWPPVPAAAAQAKDPARPLKRTVQFHFAERGVPALDRPKLMTRCSELLLVRVAEQDAAAEAARKGLLAALGLRFTRAEAGQAARGLEPRIYNQVMSELLARRNLKMDPAKASEFLQDAIVVSVRAQPMLNFGIITPEGQKVIISMQIEIDRGH